MTGFDTAHPLWDYTVVENLTGGGAAMVMKLHHSLTDGIGGMQLLLLLFDTDSDGPAQGALPDPPAGASRGTTELVTASILHRDRKIMGVARHQATTGLPWVWRASRHPVRCSRDVIETLRSVGRTVAPVSDTLSPIMTGRSLGRRLAMLEVGLDDLKQASAAAGGSVNDGFMAAVTGGLRRYHEHHGAPVDELRVTLPISIRTPRTPQPETGSPSSVSRCPWAWPTRRLGSGPSGSVAGRRAQRAIAPLHQRHRRDAQPAAVGRSGEHAQSHRLPGEQRAWPRIPGVSCRCPRDGVHPHSPTIGAAVNVTLLSYDGTCGVGVTLDTAAIPDTEVFMACLAEGFEEVLALTGIDIRVSLPLGRGSSPATPR